MEAAVAGDDDDGDAEDDEDEADDGEGEDGDSSDSAGVAQESSAAELQGLDLDSTAFIHWRRTTQARVLTGWLDVVRQKRAREGQQRAAPPTAAASPPAAAAQAAAAQAALDDATATAAADVAATVPAPSRKRKRPTLIPGMTGLRNLGQVWWGREGDHLTSPPYFVSSVLWWWLRLSQTCFLNAVLQALAHTPIFYATFSQLSKMGVLDPQYV